MELKKSVAIVSIVVSVAILGIWTWLLVQHLVPGLSDQPYMTFGHLFADFLTVVMLLTAAFGLLARKEWANLVHLASAGLLLYSGVAGAGYFAQQGDQSAYTALFALLALVAVGFLAAAFLTPPSAARQTSARTLPAKNKSGRK